MNIEKGYLAISIGEENKMFTLRSHSTHIDGWGNAVESSYHVTNLSTDPEQARNKARAIAKEREMPLNNTSWVSNSSLDTIDMWSYYMANSCRKFDDLQKVADVAELDTEKRITLSGELVHIKEYMTEWGYVQKGIFFLAQVKKFMAQYLALKMKQST
jgi:hypothetical protein